MTHANAPTRWLELWVWTLALLITAMVVVGGATRLTGSGLSITRWEPVAGALPPLDPDDWTQAFDLYRSSPQFRMENPHFSLADFKAIYWWEWVHRLLGRVLGLAALIPLAAFWRAGTLPAPLFRRGVVIVSMIAFQGALGWFMVASGLVDQPRVSHLRLAAHLVTALATFALTLWTSFELQAGPRSPLRGPALPLLFAVALGAQIAWGGFVAGLDAALVHPTWPTMSGRWVPAEAFDAGTIHGALMHPTGVQFVHRTLGALLVALGVAAAFSARRAAASRTATTTFALSLLAQFGLGVATVLHFVRHPLALGLAHQAGALVLVGATAALVFQTRARAPM